MTIGLTLAYGSRVVGHHEGIRLKSHIGGKQNNPSNATKHLGGMDAVYQTCTHLKVHSVLFDMIEPKCEEIGITPLSWYLVTAHTRLRLAP